MMTRTSPNAEDKVAGSSFIEIRTALKITLKRPTGAGMISPRRPASVATYLAAAGAWTPAYGRASAIMSRPISLMSRRPSSAISLSISLARSEIAWRTPSSPACAAA